MKKNLQHKVVVARQATTIEKIKNLIKFLGIIVFLFSLIYILIEVTSNRNKNRLDNINKNKKIVIGTIIKVGSMKGSYAVAEYYYNKRRYIRNQSSLSEYTYVGEHYNVICDSLNPNESTIDFSSPIFLNTQVTSVTSCKITDIDNYTIKYTYSINNIEFKKFQGYKQLNSNITIGKIYPVEYLIDDNRISIIKLNQ